MGLVEDDASMLDPMIEGLGRHGFEVLAATTGAAGVRLASSVDVVILDLGLPDIDGLEVCRRVRAVSEVPIIIVTARGHESDRVKGLELGADDYVVKPFSMRELAARIRANARRYVQRPPVLTVGEVTIDRQQHICTIRGEHVELTPKEFSLLVVLAEDPGRVVTRSELHARVWDPVWVGSGKSLDVHVAVLRRKLSGYLGIEAVRGVGYRLESA